LAEQEKLAKSRVLIIGLGGLGGHVLDMLARLGVGHITGADGDVFEASNLNRQLLCTEDKLGMKKAEAARQYVAAVNSLVKFTPMPVFLHGPNLVKAMLGVDAVVDALGSLKDRLDVQRAAANAGKTLISAGIAGLTGWVCVIEPGETGPAEFLGNERGIEETDGNLAPTVALAASLQTAETMKVLLGRPHQKGLLLFDLNEPSFFPLAWS
jgi:sulfur carrier protein ThiS adenylyltransferase